MKSVKVDQVTIGEGRPKIIVPITGRTKEEILLEAHQARKSSCDLVEWRIDLFEGVKQDGVVASLSHEVRELLQKPLLITFRSELEGGDLALPVEEYYILYRNIILNGSVDLIDLELTLPDYIILGLKNIAYLNNVKIVMSSHDFNSTPHQNILLHKLKQMHLKGANIAKIAVMPTDAGDVLTLLSTSLAASKEIDIPIIMIAMGEFGKVSRFTGELFGSAATFASLTEGSAPGQLPLHKVRELQDLLKLS